MDEIKKLLEQQNKILESQNKILKEGFEALILGIAEIGPVGKASNARDRLKKFREAIQEQTKA